MKKEIIAVIIGVAALIIVVGFLIGSEIAVKNLKKEEQPAADKTVKPGALYSLAAKRLAAGDQNGAVRYFEQFLDEFPRSDLAGKVCSILASIYEKRGELLKARAHYGKIYEEFPDAASLEEAKKKYEDLNIRILFSPMKTDDSIIHEVEKGDTLGKLAKEYGTTISLITKTNGLSSDMIRVGQKLKIAKIEFDIVIDKSQNILTLKGNKKVLKTYPVSTGINNSTPEGKFKIITKVKDPTWYKENAVVPPGSPNNILGTRWIGISAPGYGIHGSKDPATIGKHVTAGCVRMLNLDVEELYTIVPTGTEVVIVN